MFYRLMGVKLTNALIEKTAGSIFTGGVTLQDLVQDTYQLQDRQVGGIGCYVVEGLRQVDNPTLDNFLEFCIDAVKQVSYDQKQSHFALKLTAFISTELMEKLSSAQEIFTKDILELSYDAADTSILSKDKLRENLNRFGIENFSEEDFEALIQTVSDNQGNMT